MDLRKLIDRAKSDINGILEDLASDIECLIEEERQKSYDDGYSEGYDEGRRHNKGE